MFFLAFLAWIASSLFFASMIFSGLGGTMIFTPEHSLLTVMQRKQSSQTKVV